jgi:hypothetical protein
MTALTQDRNAPWRDAVDFVFPVAAGAVIHAGAMLTLSADGFAQPAATATGLRGIGIAQEAVDNTSGADGDRRVKVRRSCFLMKNSSATDAIGLGNVGSLCYMVDDQTVAKTNGTSTRSPAGWVRDVDDAGVWVEF